MKNTYIYIALIVLITISSCSPSPSENQAVVENTAQESIVSMSEEQWKKASIAVGQPSLSNVGKVLELNGKVEASINHKAAVCLPMGGYIISSPVLPGQLVKKGSTILYVENEIFIQLQQEYLTTKVQLELNKKEYERQSELSQANAVSLKNAEIAKRAFESSKIQLNALAEKLSFVGINATDLNENKISKRVAITSPINGYIASMNVFPGKLMRPEDVVMEITDRDHMYAVLQFFSNDIPSIHNNVDITIASLDKPSELIDAKVISVNNTLSSDGRGELYCELTKIPAYWVPGTYVKGLLQTNDHSGIVIPLEALVSWEGQDYIFEKIENATSPYTFQMTAVSYRAIDAQKVELLVSPDWMDKKIITNGAYTLLMMLKNKAEE